MAEQKFISKQVASTVTTAARFSVAPMMDWTDRHCRYFHRLISKNALLYTEMVTAPALVRGGAVHLLDFSPQEHPVAVQLGGSDPAELAQASLLCAQRGYDEINLNVGCPSDRVQSGFFGAVLMERAPLVAECVSAMIKAQPVEVTVKCRIGVDDQDPEVVLPDFLSRVRDAGVSRVTIHARKAWLQGLSPKENRDIPPLDYDIVHRMKKAFPDMHISLNGGLDGLEAGLPHLETLDGLMYGRAAYHQPWDILRDVDELVFGAPRQSKTRVDVVHEMLPYIDQHVEAGGKLGQVARHMLGLFAGQPGARGWRRTLSDGAHRAGAGSALVLEALESVQEAA
ncbi:tRNA dihydrouridine(20/20a) synthase DusA [uncultured Litoreibacter sp.]|uniref:tRNA dihydrouridine(20/20a) synthase DusA n=1 Tax=uncultured Litoreibacter sp. TaxID=1392394 RepID=UPI00261F8107|nr:tRNA dihydrouridine(20/20a) synthase DusA [uncultured Litoreibacter sp.]